MFLEAIFFSFEASAQNFSSSFYVRKFLFVFQSILNPELQCVICTGVTLFALNNKPKTLLRKRLIDLIIYMKILLDSDWLRPV